MSIPLNLGRDNQGYCAFVPKLSTDRWSATLSTDTEATVTVPSNFQQWYAVFSYQPGSNFWVTVGATAAIPAGAAFAATTSELNPSSLQVNAGDVIHVINHVGPADIGIIFYVNPDGSSGRA